MTVREIIDGCKRGSRIQQKLLLDRLAPLLMTTCKRYLTDPSCRMDVLQETFIKIFKNIAKQDSNLGSLNGWAHRICVNECINHLKKNQVKTKHLSKLTENILVPQSAISNLAVEEILELVDQLPDQYRTVFNLVAIDGYKHDEVAKILNISSSTSRSNFSRARSIMRSQLTKLEFSING